MIISNNTAVEFHYNLLDADTQQHIESSHGGDALLYLHGHNNVVKGLEKAMEGKTTGDKFSVVIEPLDGYGLRQENRQQRVPVKHLILPKKAKLQAGMIVHVQTDQGAMPALALKVGKFTVDVDLNHPLAGKKLQFDVDIVSVREATEDEIAHGHAHGVGGHQH